jgi:pSer/pThr/pTyr-binding forkhead associated (FHA) protein
MDNVCPVCNMQVNADDAACPHCGFKLQGSTQQFQPVALGLGEIAAPVKPKTVGVLHVVRGPQVGIAFKLGDKMLSIGRSPQCDIFLNDMTVSREHASVEPVEGGYQICDENSFNGVWVNNNSIDTYLLVDGDVVQIGAFCLMYKEE